jgi:hypothetical protein
LTLAAEDLEKIECEFNEKMKLIICRQCELAIAAEFISVHMNGKHAIRCSEELVESMIVRKHQPLGLEAISQFKNTTEELESRVDGAIETFRKPWKVIKDGRRL